MDFDKRSFHLIILKTYLNNLCIFTFSDNAWDSQQSSQVMYSSQNSQMSSLEMFPQQKGLIPTKFDQYGRSQSQTTEVLSYCYFQCRSINFCFCYIYNIVRSVTYKL